MFRLFLTCFEAKVFSYLAPPRFVQKIENGMVEPGSSFSFKCGIEGFPLPEVKWFKGEAEIHDEGRFLIEFVDKQAVLDIAEIVPSDQGEYVCIIKSEAGEESCQATLSVLCKYCYEMI